jgi:hypothetical protein
VPRPRPRTAGARPLPPQSDRRAGTAGASPAAAGSGLRRRVPQAHLAPELRHAPAAPSPAERRLSEHADEAASALSRYQASRQAARTAVEGS